jgi:hypothetical protein
MIWRIRGGVVLLYGLGALALAPEARAEPPRPIVAVFDLQAKRVQLEEEARAAMSDYVANRLTSSGAYQVVPRDQLRKRLTEQKLRSHKECVAQTCQIEIGKELAAQKSLATSVMRIGSRCVVTATLYDLRRATTEKGAAAKGSCSEDGIMETVDAVMAKLTGGKVPRKVAAPAAAPPAAAAATPPAAAAATPPAAAAATPPAAAAATPPAAAARPSPARALRSRTRRGGKQPTKHPAPAIPTAPPPRLDVNMLLDLGLPDGRLRPLVARLAEQGYSRWTLGRKLNVRGFRLYKRRKYRRAVPAFELAHATDPRFPVPVYNRACVAGLRGDAGRAVAWLQRLERIGSAKARQLLKRAGRDKDFNKVREAATFKAFMARGR